MIKRKLGLCFELVSLFRQNKIKKVNKKLLKERSVEIRMSGIFLKQLIEYLSGRQKKENCQLERRGVMARCHG